MTRNYHLPARKEKMRWYWWLLLAIGASGALSVGIVLYGRIMISDEKKIRNILATVEIAAETRQPRLLMAQIADNYADDYGNEKNLLGERVRQWTAMNLMRQVSVDFDGIEVVIDSDKKHATATFAVTGSDSVQEVLRWMRSRNKQVEVSFIKKSQWQIISARAADEP